MAWNTTPVPSGEPGALLGTGRLVASPVREAGSEPPDDGADRPTIDRRSTSCGENSDIGLLKQSAPSSPWTRKQRTGTGDPAFV